MRITDNINFNSIRDAMHRSKGRMDKAQLEMSSMKKLNSPSDDPVGAIKVLEIRTDKVNNDQFIRNAKLAENFLTNTDHVLENMVDIVTRAKEIAISQASGASSTDETRLGVSEEVSQLYRQAVALGNTRIGDRYLFGGYKTNELPVSNEGNYLGDDGEVMAEISKGVYLSMNVPGFEVFNSNPATSEDARKLYGIDEETRKPATEKEFTSLQGMGEENVNLFNELQSLRIGLLTGDQDGIRATLDRFDQLHSSLVANRSKIGSRISGLSSTINALERHDLTNAHLSQEIEDADMVRVMNDIAREETILRSVLSSSERLVVPSLMDFLR